LKRRFAPLALIAVLLLAFGAFAAACGDDGNGGGGELTLEEYFERLDAIMEDTNSQMDALEDPEERDLASEEEQLEAIRDFYFDANLAIIKGGFDEIEGLDPPAEVEDAHDALLAAGGDTVAAYEDVGSQLAEAESLADLQELFDDGGFEAASERFEQACLELRGIADENEIDLDLVCQD
jgi:hypothetical protein